ncbi:hypothetical protein NECAME_07934 [Necator americanus]|uniref:Nematode fatty acid retinoid binding protein n=1 Tax=Necator americanus TaxID=51031 RepID=W2TLI4_NECAM|nr:hypothetical protein NECAME_07934 [Necator americanus]ETN82489.1 hypothetical protein NECAME_07934 [Necator americanus]
MSRFSYLFLFQCGMRMLLVVICCAFLCSVPVLSESENPVDATPQANTVDEQINDFVMAVLLLRDLTHLHKHMTNESEKLPEEVMTPMQQLLDYANEQIGSAGPKVKEFFRRIYDLKTDDALREKEREDEISEIEKAFKDLGTTDKEELKSMYGKYQVRKVSMISIRFRFRSHYKQISLVLKKKLWRGGSLHFKKIRGKNKVKNWRHPQL